MVLSKRQINSSHPLIRMVLKEPTVLLVIARAGHNSFNGACEGASLISQTTSFVVARFKEK